MLDFELIDKYIAGEMTDIEKSDFEKEMLNNNEISEAVVLYKNIDNNMLSVYKKKEKVDEIKNTLTTLNKQYFNQKSETNNKKNKGKIIKIIFSTVALAATVIAVLFFTNIFKTDSITTEQILAQNNNYSPLELNVRSNDIDSLMNNVQKTFNNKEYSKIVPFLENYLQQNTDNTKLKLYLAICYMETGKLNLADDLYKKVIDSKSVFVDEAKFYLSMNYLKQNDKINCNKLLSEIKEGSEFYDKAKKVIKQLK